MNYASMNEKGALCSMQKSELEGQLNNFFKTSIYCTFLCLMEKNIKNVIKWFYINGFLNIYFFICPLQKMKTKLNWRGK